MSSNTGNRGQSSRRRIESVLIKNISDDFVKVFERYRNIVNSKINERIKQEFFDILKSQIIQSLDGSEKIILIGEIQRGSPHSTYSSESMNNSIPNYSAYMYAPVYYNNYNSNEVQIDSNYYPVDLDQNQLDNDFMGYTDNQNNYDLQPRSSNNHDANSRRSPSPCLDDDDNDDDDSSKTEPENNLQEINLIVSLYDEISNLVERNEDVVEKFINLKNIHGDEIYQKTIKYVPIDSHNIKQPIIFQLACKINKYETALDKLKEDDLFKLDQKNIFQTTLLNFLLFCGFSLFYEFLSYLHRRDIQPDIYYILLKDNSFINVLTNKNNSNDEIVNITTEKLLKEKGILFYRNLFNKLIEENSTTSKNQSFIDELITNQLLSMVLNEPINKSGSYINDLVNNYPKSESVIRSIFEKDKTVILDSSFFVLLLKKSIDSLYKILILLVKDLNVDKKVLSKACYRENEEGQSVVSIIKGNTYTSYQKQQKFISEFIEKYKSETN